MNRPLRICVIGAGPAGLTSLKALKSAGFSPVCFEMGTQVGGLWAIDNDNGRGGAYQSLHINTSTKRMEFSDFPMSTEAGDFPAHPHIAAYFRAYADAFSLTEHIHFRKEVMKCTPTGRGYRVLVRDRDSQDELEQEFDALIVANGHHWCPAFPPREIWGDFSGHVSHATDYLNATTPHNFQSERVLVVGLGNSAMDIACELSVDNASREVTVSARRGAWVIPKYILGRPLDDGSIIPQWIPGRLRRWLVTKAFRALYGTMKDSGLPEPDHLIGEAHPTVSSEFPGRVKAGAIRIKPAIKSCRGKVVEFVDGTTEEFDALVFCTGYQVKFPFFDEGHVSARDNHLPLYHRVFHLEHRHVFFVGLAQTVGAIMPVAETQAQIVAAHLKGDYNLPPLAEMRAAVARHEQAMAARFVASPRHTMQVIPEHFQPLLRKDRLAGRRRAARGLGLAFSVDDAQKGSVS